MKNKDCYIVVGDFKNFFDSLDHNYLKERLCDLLDVLRKMENGIMQFKK